MIPYVPSPEADARLLCWWHRMLLIGDLPLTFGVGAATLSTFFKHVAPPDALLLYVPDEESVVASLLVRPFMNGASAAMWIDPAHRQTPSLLAEFESAYEACLEQWPVLLGVTREALLRSHRRWGYTVVGPVPGLRDGGETGWIVRITAESYYAAKQSRLRRRGRTNGVTPPTGVVYGQ